MELITQLGRAHGLIIMASLLRLLSGSHKPFIHSFIPFVRYICIACIHIKSPNLLLPTPPFCLPSIYELFRDTSARTLNASLYASNRALTRVLSDTNASSSNSRSANKSGLYSDVTSLCWIASREKLT